ncbi:MAG: ABC transporter permease [Gemmatimonadetes bacterium]|nr:ABC transporter permease [Gemmatimonadota bacterium]
MRLALREVWLGVRRAPLLALLGVGTMALSLFAFGLFALVAMNLQASLGVLEDRVEVRAFLADSVPAEAVETVRGALASLPGVASVGYVSRDSALRRARVELEEFRDLLEGTPLPASLEVRLTPTARTPAQVQAIAAQAEALPQVEEVRYGREWVEKLHRLRTAAGVAATLLGGAFAVVALLLIGSTIRMAILTRTREIEIMRLVGATDAFIRLPYLLDGAAKGLVGGTLAVGATWGVHVAASHLLVPTQFFAPWQAALALVAGGGLGLAGSWLSVNRHLRVEWREG